MKGLQIIFGPAIETDAGSVAPSATEYLVTQTHGNKHLQRGDAVVMVEDPRANNWLLRLRDFTLHDLKGQADQYVHLKPSPFQFLKKPLENKPRANIAASKRRTEIRPGIGLCDWCHEPRFPQEDLGYGFMICLDCADAAHAEIEHRCSKEKEGNH